MLNNYSPNTEIDKKIKLINRYLKRNRTCYQIQGFKGLIKIANNDRNDEQKLIGYLNHIWVILLLIGNRDITIESVDTKFKLRKPDIIFNHKGGKFLIEIKNFHKKGFDHKIHDKLLNWQGDTLCEIPYVFDNSIYRNPFCYEYKKQDPSKDSINDNDKRWDSLKDLITQLDREERNIIIFITNCSVGRSVEQCIKDIDGIINNGYKEYLKENKKIPQELGLLGVLNAVDKYGNNYIEKYVNSEKTFIITDERQPSNFNEILTNKTMDSQLLNFFKTARLKIF